MLECMQSPTMLLEASKELTEMTPVPMNTMLEQQPRSEAIEKKIKRRALANIDVPPITPGKLLYQSQMNFDTFLFTVPKAIHPVAI